MDLSPHLSVTAATRTKLFKNSASPQRRKQRFYLIAAVEKERLFGVPTCVKFLNFTEAVADANLAIELEPSMSNIVHDITTRVSGVCPTSNKAQKSISIKGRNKLTGNQIKLLPSKMEVRVFYRESVVLEEKKFAP
ncbi:hypothetical protein WN943_013769 [Citrus x changshan-huyou]